MAVAGRRRSKSLFPVFFVRNKESMATNQVVARPSELSALFSSPGQLPEPVNCSG
jgi:hypothetical protein